MSISSDQSVELRRDVEAVQIPSGSLVMLTKGQKVVITQSLGGTYTVHAASPGGLYRIANKDADALGLESSESPQIEQKKLSEKKEINEELIWEILKTCYDPEIPVNIVDLGLIYSMQLEKLPSGNHRVLVKMTLTAPGCGMGPSIAADAKRKLLFLNGIEDATVELVWEPPWNPSMISPEGKMRLGIEG